jgi:hypothetical protein
MLYMLEPDIFGRVYADLLVEKLCGLCNEGGSDTILNRVSCKSQILAFLSDWPIRQNIF